MEKRHVTFPNGHKMPLLGLGTWLTTERDELERAMNAALDAGYRHFDTSIYYANEHILGDIIKLWIDSGKVKREELFIVTKLPGTGMEESRVGHFLKLALAALQLDYVDLYLVHMPIGIKYVDDATLLPMEGDMTAMDMTTDIVTVWRGMEAQVTAGRAKSIGLSNFNEEQIQRIIAAAKIKPANLQVEANVYFQQKALRSACAKHGITVCAYGPLGSPGRTALYKEMGLPAFVDLGHLNDAAVGAIAQAHGKTTAQVLLRFLVQQDVVVIPKSANAKRIAENAEIFDFSLTSAEMKQLEGLDRGDAVRTFDFWIFKGADKHPEFPYKDLIV